MSYPHLVSRFLNYVQVDTEADPSSKTLPSTETQVVFAKQLEIELKELGLAEIEYNEQNGFLTATLPATTKKDVRSIGFIAHLDTSPDFSGKNVRPQLVKNYDGVSDIVLDPAGLYKLTVKDFPNLVKYKGQSLITTDGSTLLGADDKAGIAEILSAVEYLLEHPEIERGKVKVAFGPDEEIGTGADQFEADKFAVDYAYTLDGFEIGELQYETFNGAMATVKIQGKSVHPGTAKDILVNALKIAKAFDDALPQDEVPEKTTGREGYFHMMELKGTVEYAEMVYIIRDHDRDKFESRKEQFRMIQSNLNARFDSPRITIDMFDQYYNMGDEIVKDMSIVEIAEQAIKNVGVRPLVRAQRGGTDGSKITFMGIPTPNIFSGAENPHGPYEYVPIESMEKATATIVEIIRLNALETGN